MTRVPSPAPGSHGRSAETAGSSIILALAPNAWAGPWMNRQQLLSRLGLHHRIIYATGVPQRGRRKAPAAGPLGALVARDNVWIDAPPAWLVRPNRFAWIRDLVDDLAVRRWQRLARRLGGTSVTAYLFHPKFWPLVAPLRPARLVYHAYDLYHLQGKQQHSFDREERALVRAADLVLASSSAIADHLRAIGAPHVELIENAADYDKFSSVDLPLPTEPVDVAGIAHPRVGYTGALNRKVDFPLFLRLSTRFPHVQFVFIGQLGRVDPAGERALAQLRIRDNVHLLGFKEPRELPEYMAAMDVNVMAYRVGDDVWTAGIYPLKLHEYLAVGQPVVSTDLPSVRPFADVIRIAATPEAWESALSDVFAGRATGSTATRRERARQNSWNARAEHVHGLLQAIASPSPAAGQTTGSQAGD